MVITRMLISDGAQARHVYVDGVHVASEYGERIADAELVARYARIMGARARTAELVAELARRYPRAYVGICGGGDNVEVVHRNGRRTLYQVPTF